MLAGHSSAVSHDREPSPPDLRERAAALKHDLGKYVAWRSANFDDAAWVGPIDDALVEALQADLLRTRQRAEGDLAAWEVFAGLTDDLGTPLPEPELRAVAAAVAVLQSHEAALRAGDRAALGPVRAELRRAQLEIRQALQALHRRLLSMPPAATVERANPSVRPKRRPAGA